jgi:tetratricopeptide (TPR) repeat protein
MRKSSIQNLWLAFVLFGCSYSVRAQSLAQTFDLAESFYAQNDYTRASQTYRRVLFFDEQKEYSPRCFYKIADCLYRSGRYSEAAPYFDQAYFSSGSDSLRAETLFQKASCYLLMQDYRYAQVELLNMPDHLTEQQQFRLNMYNGILYFSLEEYETSRDYFFKIAKDSTAKVQIKELFEQNKRIEHLSPRRARLLSMLLPGLGQFYAGDVKNGAVSLLLNSGLMYWGARMLATGGGVDAIFTVLPWFQRYYAGGFNKTALIAEERKQKQRREVYNKLLDTIQPY